MAKTTKGVTDEDIEAAADLFDALYKDYLQLIRDKESPLVLLMKLGNLRDQLNEITILGALYGEETERH